MDLGTVLSVAQTLFAALQCSELKEILSVFGYKTQLDDLRCSVSTINAVLRDAETKLELSHEAQHWIDELKDVVFEADDLFDEFVTLAEQKKLMETGCSLSRKVSHFFSRSNNQLTVAYKMSRGVKDIKKKMDAIATNCQQFSFKIDYEPIKKRGSETCSYVNEIDIIGRESELENIVDMLLDSNVKNVSGSSLEVHPKSITRLHNLQTLKLDGCYGLKELPNDLSRLVNLRVLLIGQCSKVSYMPSSMGKLACLYKLSDYIVGSAGSSNTICWKQWLDGLENLRHLNNLRGCLNINIRWPENVPNVVKEDYKRDGGSYIRSKEHLELIRLTFKAEGDGKIMDDDGTIRLMEELQPHPNLKRFSV
ncbi:hypothetical protein RDABS01_013289 [Bienertia sinuspersici]